jgi:hypothetical protein
MTADFADVSARAVKLCAMMQSPWVGREAAAALLNKSLSTVDRIAATGAWGRPRIVYGSPLWPRATVLEWITLQPEGKE